MEIPDIPLLSDETIAKLRAMTGAERVMASFEMFEISRDLMLKDVAQEHPAWSDVQVRAQVIAEMEELDKNPPLWAEDWFNRDDAIWLEKLRPHRKHL
jgi:hypothetical protein